VLSSSGRFTGSRGLVSTSVASNASYLPKTSGINDAVHHISIAFMQTSALVAVGSGTYGLFFHLIDGSTTQCAIGFVNDGGIRLVSGLITSGTTLATYLGAFTAANIWYQFEIEVVINNTTGSFTVRKNGNTTNDFTATGLNSRTSANNYVNKIGVGCVGAAAGHNIDDFLWRSDASSVAWIGDVRCYTRMPAADSAVQFTRSGSVVPVTPFVFSSALSSSNTVPRYQPFVATCDGTVGSAVVSIGSGYTGNMKCTLFNNNNGTPGTILASATTISNPVIGNNTFTFGSSPSVVRGTTYWIGLATDTSVVSTGWNVSASVTGAYSFTGFSGSGSPSYVSFPVANPAGGAAQAVIFTANITPTTAANANLVAEVAQDAAAGYVLSSTNGQADLYTLQAVPSTPFLPATVIGVTTRGLFQKSDAGTRNATVQLKSGGTTVAGASTALPVGSWQWIARNDLVDPATSAAWTPSGVNAALVGPAVTA
jgi:hypothetical protein